LPFVWPAGVGYVYNKIKGYDPQPYYNIMEHIWLEK
jgi:hypothetical protein